MKTLAFLAIFTLGVCFQITESKVLTCMVDGVRHKIGEEFIMKDCSGVCQCLKDASGHDGFSCLPLCGTYYLRCGPGQKRVYYKRPYPGTKCSCPHQKCVPEEPQ